MCCDLVQYGVLFAKIAHEKLLDLQSAGVPPRQADQECIGARAAREAGCFGVEKKPFGWIGESSPCALGNCFVASAREQFEAYFGHVGLFRRRKPVAHQHVLPVTIRCYSRSQEARQRILRVRSAQQLSARWPRPRWFERGNPREPVGECSHYAHSRSSTA